MTVLKVSVALHRLRKEINASFYARSCIVLALFSLRFALSSNMADMIFMNPKSEQKIYSQQCLSDRESRGTRRKIHSVK